MRTQRHGRAPSVVIVGAQANLTSRRSSLVSGIHLTIGSMPVRAAKGIYTWKRQGTALTLRATDDKSCSPRRLLFTGVWRKT